MSERLNIQRTRELLQGFEFRRLFIEELGWNKPSLKDPLAIEVDGVSYSFKMISELGGVAVLEVTAENGSIPQGSDLRRKLHRKITDYYGEHLLIFLDKDRTNSSWYWVKREGNKDYPREHDFLSGQTGELFLAKLQQLFVDMSELDSEGKVTVVAAAEKLKHALDQERTTKKFFKEYGELHAEFLSLITGIANDHDRRWYASIILNRMMFIYFLQGKGFIDNGDRQYLQNKMDDSVKRGPNQFFSVFLNKLFFEGFAKREEDRDEATNRLLGKIRYLNGGLFLPHRIEIENPKIAIPDKAFRNLLALFRGYTWNLDDRKGGHDDELNPDVLGYIFEKYINQKAFGAYYTRTEITEYLCEHTITDLVLDRIHKAGFTDKKAATFGELKRDVRLAKYLLNDLLPSLKILDPACGSGAFLVAAMKTLIDIYSPLYGWIDFLNDTTLTLHKKQQTEHGSLNYHIKKRIITDNLFGVDLMEEATEIAKLRLFLNLVQSVSSVDELEPLPNIDFNILPGNSLIGLLHTDSASDLDESKSNLFRESFRSAVAEKNLLVQSFRHFSETKKVATAGPADLTVLRDNIDKLRAKAANDLNNVLLQDFNTKHIQFEEATWDDKAGKEGKPKKRPLASSDIEALHPFHWGYEFNEIMERGGFDLIITNPPWDVFQTSEKEFFQSFFPEVQKNKIPIDLWKKQFKTYMKDGELRKAWLNYASRFPFLSKYFKSAAQYAHQQPIIDGHKAGGKINVYSLFLEQSYNLIRDSGRAGLVIPSGIYTDQGDTGLRQLLFLKNRISALFGFENRKVIFEGVDSRFKFVVLTFEKGGKTTVFPAAFMRHNVSDLASFPNQDDLTVDFPFVQRLSPKTLSLLEFRTSIDRSIVEKALQYPSLEDEIEGAWRLRVTTDFNMTTDSYLFKDKELPGSFPLYEGKMFHQFEIGFADPKNWLLEKEARAALLGRATDNGHTLGYQMYRLAFRDVAASTNERTMIATVLPPNVFCPHTVSLENVESSWLTNEERIVLCALLNSFVVDFSFRQSVTNHLSFFIVYNQHVPRLTSRDQYFYSILRNALRLICTGKEYAKLYNAVMRESGTALKGMPEKWTKECGAYDPAERMQLRAELDGMIAHIYGLTEEEFAHILSTFPIVEKQVKDLTMEKFRALAPKSADEELRALIKRGEGLELEFKETARWDINQKSITPIPGQQVVKSVSGFLNSHTGGTLLIGVHDSGSAPGIERDLATFGQKHEPHDEFQQYLQNLLLKGCGKEFAANFHTTFHSLDGKEVCKITVKPSVKAVYVTESGAEKFYVRSGNTTQSLSMRESNEYVRSRFG